MDSKYVLFIPLIGLFLPGLTSGCELSDSKPLFNNSGIEMTRGSKVEPSQPSTPQGVPTFSKVDLDLINERITQSFLSN
jgi:hypothetical protein